MWRARDSWSLGPLEHGTNLTLDLQNLAGAMLVPVDDLQGETLHIVPNLGFIRQEQLRSRSGSGSSVLDVEIGLVCLDLQLAKLQSERHERLPRPDINVWTGHFLPCYILNHGLSTTLALLLIPIWMI